MPESEPEPAKATAKRASTKPVEASLDIIAVDDRLLALERQSLITQRSLVQVQDVLIDQMIGLGILEIVFALFLAINVWVQYKATVREAV